MKKVFLVNDEYRVYLSDLCLNQRIEEEEISPCESIQIQNLKMDEGMYLGVDYIQRIK